MTQMLLWPAVLPVLCGVGGLLCGAILGAIWRSFYRPGPRDSGERRHWSHDGATRKEFYEFARHLSLSDDEIFAALEIAQLDQYPGTYMEARDAAALYSYNKRWGIIDE